MGCIAEETGEAVRGILVAGDHHPRVKLAARAIPNLTLKKYRYRFEFE
jgi:endonuclease